MMTRSLTLAVLSLLTLSGCYNPELGETPFQCAVDDPRCPEGYTCRMYKKVETCMKAEIPDVGVPDRKILKDWELPPSKEGAVFLDGWIAGSAKGCADESSEPNNGAPDATELPTGISTDWEICYVYDIDQYKISLKSGETLTVTVKFTHSTSDIDAAIFDPDGFLVSASRSTTNEEKLTAKADQDGNYILGVWGFNLAVGKYDLDVSKQ